MQKKDYLKKIWLSACVYYTATTFLLIFLFWLISDDITRAMHPVALMLILPFSICFAAANTGSIGSIPSNRTAHKRILMDFFINFLSFGFFRKFG